MLKPDGSLFHLDFGFILGSDCRHRQQLKKWVPPIRIPKPIIEAIGGDAAYVKFKERAADAFLQLRVHRQYIISAFMLMIDAGIPDLPFNRH